ncbi:MAG: lipopolysaccharide biosynthesis protein, partial [Bilophila wadsworthia]
TCFYNALSRRQYEMPLVAFYGRVSALVFLVTMLAGVFLLVPGLGDMLLPDVPLWYAPLAAFYGFLLWGTRVVRSMNDALGLTVPGEFLRSGVNLLGAIIILALFWFGFLNAGSLFGLQYLMMGSIVIGCLAIMRRSWAHIDLSLTRDQRLSYTREFSDYSMPLFVQALLSALALSAERWVLQWFDGSTQQGYFALSQRVSAACFLFVSAMTPLIMRELAIAWGKDDREHMGHLLTRFAPLLFGIAAWFSCFTAVEASVLVHIFGGAEFAAALVPVQIMALYPAHQAYGQLASSVFHATGKTKVLRNLAASSAGSLLGPGARRARMGLGATGLALKTVTTQFIMVNLLFWMASRLIPLNFFRNLMLQGLILGSLLGIAWVCKQATGIYFADDAHQIIRFFLSGILYSFMSFGLVVTCPWLFGAHGGFREMLIRSTDQKSLISRRTHKEPCGNTRLFLCPD